MCVIFVSKVLCMFPREMVDLCINAKTPQKGLFPLIAPSGNSGPRVSLANRDTSRHCVQQYKRLCCTSNNPECLGVGGFKRQGCPDSHIL